MNDMELSAIFQVCLISIRANDRGIFDMVIEKVNKYFNIKFPHAGNFGNSITVFVYCNGYSYEFSTHNS